MGIIILAYILIGYPIFVLAFIHHLRKIEDIPRWVIVGIFFVSAMVPVREILMGLLLLYVYNVDLDKVVIKKKGDVK